MGLADWLTRRAMRRNVVEVAQLVHDMLAAIPDSSKPETKFRDDAARLLRKMTNGDVELKRELGVHGTYVDLHLHLHDHDFLITIKKGPLGAQKIKTVNGEIVGLLDAWKPRIAENVTFIILFLYNVKHDREFDALNPFVRLAEQENARRKDFFITHTFAGSASAPDDEA